MARVLETRDLTVYYGRHRGILNINLRVEEGEIFGFLGPNGAGKTTTQRVLMDIIHPNSGQAMIFGMDCQQDGVAVRERVGYLPGELSLYPDMKGQDFLDMVASLRGNALDVQYRDQLCQRLDFDPSRRMREYSRGNKQKIGIIAAFMPRPDLLILDEPTSGLDPLVQQTVLELIREVRADGRTVFLSSHILPEVQAVCDRVGIIREGELIETARVEELTRQTFKRVILTFRDQPAPDVFDMDGVTVAHHDTNTVILEVQDCLPEVMTIAAKFGIEDIEVPHITLEDTFLNYYERRQDGGN